MAAKVVQGASEEGSLQVPYSTLALFLLLQACSSVVTAQKARSSLLRTHLPGLNFVPIPHS